MRAGSRKGEDDDRVLQLLESMGAGKDCRAGGGSCREGGRYEPVLGERAPASSRKSLLLLRLGEKEIEGSGAPVLTLCNSGDPSPLAPPPSPRYCCLPVPSIREARVGDDASGDDDDAEGDALARAMLAFKLALATIDAVFVRSMLEQIAGSR